MRWEATLLASSLVVVQAAPRLFDQAVKDVSGFEDAVKRDRAAAAALHVADGLYARFHAEMTTLPAGCPTASVVVSTTTVDVTVYITAEAVAESTEPCPDETSTSTSALSTTTASQSTPAPTAPGTISKDSSPPEETGKWNSTTSVASTPPQTPNAAATSTTIPLPIGPGSSIAVVLVSKNSTATTEPCPDETPSSTAGSSTSSQPHEAIATTVTSTQSTTRTSRVVTPPSVTSSSSSSSSVTPSSTMPPTTTAATPPTIVIIDPAMTPVTKSTLTVTPTSVAPPTKTVCEHSNPTGAPSRDTQYCGVKGSPAGVYFIAEFIEERPGVPVTEEGCYQFCDSVMEDTKGCKSYRFYQNALGAPRCDLYGMPVSYALKDLDTNQPGKWYDLACGCPTSEGWHDTSMPEHKKKKAAAIATPATATTAIPTKTTPAAEPKQDNHLLDLKLGPLSIGL